MVNSEELKEIKWWVNDFNKDNIRLENMKIVWVIIYEWIDKFIFDVDYNVFYEDVLDIIVNRFFKRDFYFKEIINYKFDEKNICEEILKYIDIIYLGYYFGKWG